METLQEFITSLPVTLLKVILTVIIVFLFETLRRILYRVVTRDMASIQSKLSTKQGMTITFYLVTLFIIFYIWFRNLDYFLTSISIIAVGLTITSKELILNFISSWIILWRNLFVVGDRIEIAGVKGDVVNKGVLFFTLVEVGNWSSGEQSTGRLIRVPNWLILNYTIANYTKDFPYIWDEVIVPLTPEADWKKAKNILHKAILSYSHEKNIDYSQAHKELGDSFPFYKRLSPGIYMDIKEGEILLTMRYLCEAHKRREAENYLWEYIMEEMSQDDTVGLNLRRE